ncbi:uncharacterized protein MONBRDRAFT_26678 [Monosiga brevicollis MX1]|uniref:SET domain-containing protein n=1 Tax=Monosiga brevicollis TaxID=81824 RepID=A9V321_MONBE|nr:uncharacterized protein MONBRDRAFT_26678 [Monosiga brevicollis MX1]EDQ88110.1 predicted protein [Monosiga brevicollis MX1]|eukprot:XP_001747186.1 hypothetical protein [Monosiga brevicollis MX1]
MADDRTDRRRRMQQQQQQQSSSSSSHKRRQQKQREQKNQRDTDHHERHHRLPVTDLSELLTADAQGCVLRAMLGHAHHNAHHRMAQHLRLSLVPGLALYDESEDDQDAELEGIRLLLRLESEHLLHASSDAHDSAVTHVQQQQCRNARTDDHHVIQELQIALDRLATLDCNISPPTLDAYLRLSSNAHGLFAPEWIDVAVCACTDGLQLINHSCLPNAALDYEASLAQSRAEHRPVIVLRAIVAGLAHGSGSTLKLAVRVLTVKPSDVVTISYVNLTWSLNRRQRYLMDTIGFVWHICFCLINGSDQ